MLSGEVPEERGHALNRRPIDVHIEEAEEDADADSLRLQVLRFHHIDHVGDRAVRPRDDDRGIRRRRALRIPEEIGQVERQHGRHDGARPSTLCPRARRETANKRDYHTHGDGDADEGQNLRPDTHVVPLRWIFPENAGGIVSGHPEVVNDAGGVR